jgi:hypothetical protein
VFSFFLWWEVYHIVWMCCLSVGKPGASREHIHLNIHIHCNCHCYMMLRMVFDDVLNVFAFDQVVVRKWCDGWDLIVTIFKCCETNILNQQFLVVQTLLNGLYFGWLSQLRICWDRFKHQIKSGLSNEKSYGQHLCLPGPSINGILLSKHAGIPSPDGAYWFVLHPS